MVFGDLRFELGSTDAQHAAQLVDIYLVEQALGFAERKPQLLQGHEPVQTLELAS